MVAARHDDDDILTIVFMFLECSGHRAFFFRESMPPPSDSATH